MANSATTAKELKHAVLKELEPTPHHEILDNLLTKVTEIDFEEEADLDKGQKLRKRHYVVIVIEKILELAEDNSWGLCKRNDFIYLYNGAYWKLLDEMELKVFLGEAADKMGVDKYDSHYHRFKDDLLNQFISEAYLPAPNNPEHIIFINLKNGTLEINPESSRLVKIRNPRREDFLIYQLPFKYDKGATAPTFQKHLNYVLPNKQLQQILAEYIGYLFVRTEQLKLEKALILFGSGGNGKSVIFDVVNALLGDENISTYTLRSLTNTSGYQRAKIANKLVNYSSEINRKMNTAIFKQLVSGEPVEARLPYGEPFIMKNYAKLIFNSNKLPSDVEHTHAFFRRFLIIPFDVTIPEDKQEKDFVQKIIKHELSGVFNWVLAGLKRVLKQRDFTVCDITAKQTKTYRRKSDSVQLFISERGYEESYEEMILLKRLYGKYKSFCRADEYRPVSKQTFSERLEKAGYEKKKKSEGMAFYLKKKEN